MKIKYTPGPFNLPLTPCPYKIKYKDLSLMPSELAEGKKRKMLNMIVQCDSMACVHRCKHFKKVDYEKQIVECGFDDDKGVSKEIGINIEVSK